MIFIDSHCHLTDPRMVLEEVLQRAEDQSVKGFLSINTHLGEIDRLQALSAQHLGIWTSVGIHPNEIRKHVNSMNWNEIEQELYGALRHPKTIGIGETGLDYHYTPEDRELQIESFERHLEMSAFFQKPVIIHTREANEDVMAILSSYSVSGIFHCFGGDQKLAQYALDHGFLISFSGILTFKNATQLQKIASYVPLDRILIETDSPYLTPEPHRGRLNEPAHVRLVAEKLAGLKRVSLERVAQETTENFMTLFPTVKEFLLTPG
jgi:TatD DNase family protein